ncbi:hypothetical protein DV738_g5123, partial [Chaetothyriales sp. CBS 135597]
MSSGGRIFLRTLPSGLKLYLHEAATNGTWRRVPGLSDEDYFSTVVGNRVDEEAEKHKQKIEAKTGKVVDRAVIEDGFHESPSDIVSHAGVVYETSTGEHLSKKHVAEKKEDQAKSDRKTGK